MTLFRTGLTEMVNTRNRSLPRPRSILLLALAFSLLFAGCARPPKPKIDNLYRGLNENLPRLDPRLLDGRRIVVDPGHGGHFSGTRGQDGLDESAVNLGVALYLWGLLNEAGAEAFLTRSAERDFLGDAADSTVTADLQVRVDMVETVRPDIVVSIHHNAEPSREPRKNAIETYYRLGDPASRDLAFAVHRHLARNLGIEQGDVRPGNYFILRGVSAPAILGEGSYLTNPGVETTLRLSEKQRLEAEAYFLGILEYFSRGTPVVAPLRAGEDSVFADLPMLAYSVTDVGGLGVDPGGVDMTLNGAPVPAALDASGNAVRYHLPWDAPNGTYEISLVVRNLLGNSSRALREKIVLDLPAEHAVFDCDPPGIPQNGGPFLLRARLLDRRGLAVAEGHPVSIASSIRMSADDEWRTLPEIDTHGLETAKDGVVELVIDLPSGATGLRVTLRPRGPSGKAASAEAVEDDAGVRETTDAGDRVFSYVVEETLAAAAPRSVVVLSRATSEPVNDARLSGADGGTFAPAHSGRYLPRPDARDEELRVQAPGYRPQFLAKRDVASVAPDTVYLEPWYGGRLRGYRIIVNPEGGTGRNDVRGPLGLSGPQASLQVARYLEEYLAAAGSRATLARDSEATPLERDVVALANRMKADAYVEIRYSGTSDDTAASVRTYHFPGSARGVELAAALGEALGRSIRAQTRPPSDTVTYSLQQTACPAVIVEPPSIGILEEELRLSEPWYQRRQAYGIFCGILRHAGVADATSLGIVLSADAPAESGALSNWLVAVDDTWRLLTAPDGTARFDCLPPGPHRVTVSRGERLLGPVDIVIDGDENHLEIAVPRLP